MKQSTAKYSTPKAGYEFPERDRVRTRQSCAEMVILLLVLAAALVITLIYAARLIA